VIRIRTELANGSPQADRVTLSTVPGMKAVDRPLYGLLPHVLKFELLAIDL
jgi:hypothetical protein